jgi:aryl-alcohol dehydrogenase-like predicted oxidoreductase
MHPRGRRCSSFEYSRYSQSSRLARGAPRPSRCHTRLSPPAARLLDDAVGINKGRLSCERSPLHKLDASADGPTTRVLDDAAAAVHATPMQLALAWLLQRSPNILLIPGTSSVAHLRENLEASRLEIPSHVLNNLDSIGRSTD